MKKKILVIGPGMEIGGVERALLGLLNSIDYERYEVDLFLFAHTGELMPLINPQANLLPEQKCFSLVNYPIVSLFKKGHFLIGFIRLFSKIIGDFRAKRTKTESLNITICKKTVSKIAKPLKAHYDIALGFFGPHYYLENKVDADFKIGWAHTDYSNANEKPDTGFTLPMWAGLDYIACVSEQAKASFDSVYPTLKEKTFVIENIISAEFVRAQAEAFAVSEEMPAFEGSNILSVGRFCTAKNFDNIPAVCKQLKEQGISLRWYLIGYGQDEALIKEKIAEAGTEDTVIILGKKTNPYPYIKACDIYAQPSRYEAKAVTVTEAQILGKPVMITRYKTASSQVEEGVDGYICEQNNEGIAEGIKAVIENKQLREQLIVNTAKRDYSGTVGIQKIWELAEKQ